MHVPSSVNPYSSGQHSSSVNKQINKCNSYSLPNLTSCSHFQVHIPSSTDFTMVQRSYSFGGLSSTKRLDSTSQNQATLGLNHIAKHHRPNSIHPQKLHHLMRSYSAPSIGFVGKRRHSLQHLDTYRTEESWEVDTKANRVNPMGRSHLRRTSSEVYVDGGKNGLVISPRFEIGCEISVYFRKLSCFGL